MVSLGAWPGDGGRLVGKAGRRCPRPACDSPVQPAAHCRGWGGTLVVSPTPIHGQWLGELQQHSGLRVEVYYGLTWHRSAGTGPSRNRQVHFTTNCLIVHSLGWISVTS